MTALIVLSIALLAGLVLAIVLAWKDVGGRFALWVFTAILLFVALAALWLWPGWVRLAVFPPTPKVVVTEAAPLPAPAAETTGTDAEVQTPKVTDAEFDKGVETTIEGPAIIQWWDGSTAGCGIIRVDTGRSFTWSLMGHWWTFNSQSALESDWPNSLDQYTADNPQCTSALPEGALK